MDYPVAELVKKANAALAAMPGAKVYFKFTCPHCGERVLFEEPNTYYAEGECAACGKSSPFTSGGFLLHVPTVGMDHALAAIGPGSPDEAGITRLVEEVCTLLDRAGDTYDRRDVIAFVHGATDLFKGPFVVTYRGEGKVTIKPRGAAP